MNEREFDYALVGGGLQNALIALALAQRDRPPRVVLVERGQRLGGNHTWCFHQDDVPPAARSFVAELVEQIRLRGPRAVTARLASHMQQEVANVFLLVDQFEELFRFPARAEKARALDEARAFCNLLLAAA